METETKEASKTRSYQAGEFEGPLDLLWTLIRESKVNIYDIPISEITEQYLDYLDNLKETDLQDLSEFYSWAAKLVLIKSRMLLPVEIEYDDEEMEDPRQELVDRLIEYQKFKKLSELMEESNSVYLFFPLPILFSIVKASFIGDTSASTTLLAYE